MGCGCTEKNKLSENKLTENLTNNIPKLVTNMTNNTINEISLEQFKNMSVEQMISNNYRLKENPPEYNTLRSLSVDVQNESNKSNDIQSLETGASFQFSNTAIVVFGAVVLTGALLIASYKKKKSV